jgi:hypothetical protein
MPSRAVVEFIAAALIGGSVLTVIAAFDRRELDATVPVPTTEGSATVAQEDLAGIIRPGATICELPVRVRHPIDGIQTSLVTGGLPGPPLLVTLHRPGSDRPLASARIAAGYRATGYPALPVTTARFETVLGRQRVTVCITNHGHRDAALYAGKAQRSRRSHGVSLARLTHEPQSFLATLPEIFERAERFKPTVIGAWTFWGCLAALLLVVPGLLAFGLHRATRPTAECE